LKPACRAETEKQEKGRQMKVIIIGGVAAGSKVASKVIRMRPDADVTVIEKGTFMSYAGCGLPYYISGEVKEQKQLMETPSGDVRDLVFFQNIKNVNVMNVTEAIEIDRAQKRVHVRKTTSGEESWVPYDTLVLATGATPIRSGIPGVDKKNVFTLHGVHDAEGIKAFLARGKAKDVVIIGGGLIGVEITEALATHGCRVTIVEKMPQILTILDEDMAKLVEQHLESKGVKVLTNTRAVAIEGEEDEVTGVQTEKGLLSATMVILAIGVEPNTHLAKQAGLTLGEKTDAIQVDGHMRTSDPNIYAAGDCVECINRLTGLPCFVPLGSTANKQGRVAAINICGGDEMFPGILGSCVCKVFDFCVARTGLSEKTARELGYEVITSLAPGPDKASYMPDVQLLMLKLISDAQTGRLLGAQAAGSGDGAKRIDVAATAISAGMTLDDVANLDLCYAPPYAPAMDNLITAANVSRNKRDGLMEGISAEDIYRKIKQHEDYVLVDVRSIEEFTEGHLPNAVMIPLGVLRKRLDKIPKDKEVIVYCEVAVRGYEAGLILKAAGYTKVKVLCGGMAMWPYEKER